ncbi:MAG: 50S ribosomal protein L11 methyltransferase [Ignavibacteriales bacterium]|nr:50S ribosomal protein L11 methyltransferase [Ignavibacteriales bacterium]
MKHYKQFGIQTEPQNNEMISGLLWQLDLSGITETDNGLIVYANETKTVSAKNIRLILDKAITENIIKKYDLTEEEFEDKNWNEEYEKNVRVIEVSSKIVIKPSFKDYQLKEGQIIITIDPKMSFGTGEHETTRLVLLMLEKHTKKDDYVLDVGTGTGVLAIASVMLGAKKSVGIDNDEWCLLNGSENVKLNGLEDKVEIELAELNQLAQKDFDLIVANINKHILLEICGDLKNKIKQTGTLILSGLLYSDEFEILEKYSSFGFTLIEKNQMNEWISLVFKIKN